MLMPLPLLLMGLWAWRARLALILLLLWVGGAATILLWPRGYLARAQVAPAETTSFAVSALLSPQALSQSQAQDTRPTGNFAVYLAALRSPEAARMLTTETTLLQVMERQRQASTLAVLRAWLGFNRGSINVKQNDRLKGNSSYTLRKLLSLGIDVATSQSTSFLNFSILFGAIFIISSAIFLIILFTTSFILNFHTGWLSIVTLILFSTGLILFMLGINGIYVGKIFMQSKNRPIFIISEEM